MTQVRCSCEEWYNENGIWVDDRDLWSFCPYCGKRLVRRVPSEEKPKPDIFCLKCNGMMHYDDVKCQWCGYENKIELMTLTELAKQTMPPELIAMTEALSKPNPLLTDSDWKEQIPDIFKKSNDEDVFVVGWDDEWEEL